MKRLLCEVVTLFARSNGIQVYGEPQYHNQYVVQQRCAGAVSDCVHSAHRR